MPSFPEAIRRSGGSWCFTTSLPASPLAVMESSYLTALRTGLVGALGADVLARPTASTVAIIGAGAQGQAQLAALRRVRPLTAVRVFDHVPEAGRRLADNLAKSGS